MRLFVTGATGRTGALLVPLALEHGHHVTAFVRQTSRRPLPHEGLSVVTGDVLKPETLLSVLEGHDAVISLLAPRPRRSGRVYVEGTRNLADAAQAAGVRRLVVVSAEGAGAVPESLPMGYRAVMRVPLVARLYADIERMEAEVRALDNMDWTLVAPAILTNRTATGAYRVETTGPVAGGLELPRADLAAFVLHTIETGDYVHQRVAVAR